MYLMEDSFVYFVKSSVTIPNQNLADWNKLKGPRMIKLFRKIYFTEGNRKVGGGAQACFGGFV